MGSCDDAVRARHDKVSAARKAVDKLRDSARLGTIIYFRERDPLVRAIHDALDLVLADTASKEKA